MPAAATAAPSPAPAAAGVRADFNGDGWADLAVGVPYEDVGSAGSAGAVNVIYGSALGLKRNGNQLLHEGLLAGAAEANDRFGSALAAGDFNGDGRTDLAIGVAGENVSGHTEAGAVSIVYGSAAGLKTTGDQLWDQSQLSGALEAGDRFGSTLAAADLNGDGRTDLAVGVQEDLETAGTTAEAAGAINVIYGSATGLSAAGNQLWHQGRLAGAVEAADGFGDALAAGDLNGDRRADLIVGVPQEDVDGINEAGAVNVIYGSPTGLATAGNQLWTQRELAGTAEAGDRFGAAVTAGDFNGDGSADLVAGVQYEDVGSTSDAGAVNVIYGSSAGLRAAGNQLWDQDSLHGAAFAANQFGAAVATGDFNADGRADLAVGVPNESVYGFNAAGAVNVIHGSSAGLLAGGDQVWHQGSLSGNPEDFDQFGAAVATGDFNGDGRADLAVGVDREDVDDNEDVGVVNAVYGNGFGLARDGNQVWDQNALTGAGEPNDSFGHTLAAG
ncbi:hypothetical protein [Actinoplanes sp. NPDC049118]|uniref:FG-GAP repeat protein n=1 Tax=Actinoplanes sp. NPDC049118 TaxID=3155769 RepID=UPI0033DC4D1B